MSYANEYRNNHFHTIDWLRIQLPLFLICITGPTQERSSLVSESLISVDSKKLSIKNVNIFQKLFLTLYYQNRIRQFILSHLAIGLKYGTIVWTSMY